MIKVLKLSRRQTEQDGTVGLGGLLTTLPGTSRKTSFYLVRLQLRIATRVPVELLKTLETF